jgi:hypothetical protein
LSEAREEWTAELLKWAFLFWIGQVFAVAGLMAVVIRSLRPGG